NYEVTCEDKAKRRNSGTKTKTFEENCYLLPYAVSGKEDMAYQRQLVTRIRVMINSRFGVSLFTYTLYAQLVISQRYEVNVIDGDVCANVGEEGLSFDSEEATKAFSEKRDCDVGKHNLLILFKGLKKISLLA
ncbi:hypothetical protein Tco_0021144, partial [Tanacetum coccineum]